MTTTDIAATAPPPWSLAAPATSSGGHPARTGYSPQGRGTTVPRPEDLEEKRQFSAALKDASSYTTGNQAPTWTGAALPTANNPEDRWMADRNYAEGADSSAVAHKDAQSDAREDAFFGEDGFTVSDLIDIVNPLQHLPIISSLYRDLTGDEISPGARLAGGTLFGGPVGFVSSLANNVVEETTGQDIGQQMASALFGEDAGIEDATTIAALDSASPNADPAATDAQAAELAAIAPAAGAKNAAGTNSNVTQQAALALPQGPVQAVGAGPLFSTRSTGMAISAGPVANSPAAPQLAAVSTPAVAPRTITAVPPSSAQTSPAQNSGTPASTPPGVPSLSPQAADVLMRMAEQSQVAAMQAHTAEVQSRTATRRTTITSPAAASEPTASKASAPEVAATRPAVRQSAASQPSTAAATASVSERAQTAAYIEPVPEQDLPSAMMEALSKYESLKRGE